MSLLRQAMTRRRFCGWRPRSSAAPSIRSARPSSKGAEARKIALADAEGFAAIPGHGVSGRVDGRDVLLGNAKLMRDRGIAIESLLARLGAPGQRRQDADVCRSRRQGRSASLAVADTVKPDFESRHCRPESASASRSSC